VKLTEKVKKVLDGILHRKLAEVLGDDTFITASKWTEYLEGVGCRRVHKEKKKHGEFFVMVDDPFWRGDQILMPRDLMDRVVVLGEMP
jgi:hypothetical protein